MTRSGSAFTRCRGGRISRIRRLAALLATACVLSAVAIASASADAAGDYAKECGSCHGADGKAETPVAKAMKVPALAGRSLAPAAIVDAVRTSPKHKKPSQALDDAALAAVAKYLESGLGS